MRVLLVGTGGREHALGWKIAESDRVDELLSLPGNPGLETLGATIRRIDPSDPGAVAAVARVHRIDLAVIGPEAPLAAGVADGLTRVGVPCFGPSQAAARLESSKTFAKALMDRAGVATARWWSFTDPGSAHAHLDSCPGPFVVKADGLAAGKGVLVTDDRAAAHDWVERCQQGDFGQAGERILVEEHLAGREVSVLAFCAGTTALPLPPVRDYKRLADGDLGPNTGGMGGFSPVADVPAEFAEHTLATVIEPILKTMADNGQPYVGFLYAGMILTAEGPKVLEFNCRLGDPEAQIVLPRLRTDIVEVFEAALAGRLDKVSVHWSEDAAVGVVVATEGYPENPVGGHPILGLDEASQHGLVFHAATTGTPEAPLTKGGRTLTMVGVGKSIEVACRSAYQGVECIRFPGMTFRTDIAAGDA